MRLVLEHIKSGTIPHDLIEFFTDVPFYEGCMIVQIYDHKSAAPVQGSTRANTGATKTIPFSVHNYNAYLTPSSYVPYPAQNTITGKGKLVTDEGDDKSKSAEQMDKENMPAPTMPNDGQRNKQQAGPRKPRIHTVVLHPTPLSSHVDLATKAAEARSGSDGRRDSRQDGGPLSATVPPTPTTAIPSTPQLSMAPPAKRVKRTKVDLDSANIHAAEGQIVQLTTAPLSLDPVGSARESAALLASLAHPMHSEKPPLPKTRKRTVAEMAADEALAADQERYMLILDERLSSNAVNAQGGANPPDGNGQAGGASFEPRFEKFKALENIKHQHEENKKIEKQRREEADRKLQQERERNKLRDEAKEREEKQRNLAAQQAANNAARQHQQQQQQQAQAQAQAQQEAHRRSQMQSQQMQQGIPAQHAHPHVNGTMANGIPAQPQRFHQQQVSQAQTSSPIVRNGTPQSHSSPTVNGMGNVPMQQSTSSMGGSPPRPGSVVNHPQMGAPTGMSAQRSQQSHAGTPRMPNSTPNVQSTPLNRQMSQTPRMSQGSPQGPMASAPQMMMQQQQMTPQQAALQQQRLQMIQNQQAQRMMGGQMNPAGQMNAASAQQMLQAQQIMRQQQLQQQQGIQQGSIPAQLAQNYAATMAAMAQRAGPNPNMNMNFGNNQSMANMQPMNIQQMQQMQQMQMQQAARAQAAQAQAHAHAQAQAQAQAAQAQAQTPQHQMFQQQILAVANTLCMWFFRLNFVHLSCPGRGAQLSLPSFAANHVVRLHGGFPSMHADQDHLDNQQKPILLQQHNGLVPDEADKNLRQRCHQAAQQQVTAGFRAR